MDALNLRIMVVTGNPGRIPREQMLQDLQVLRGSPHKDRFAAFANIAFRNVGPGFGQRAAEQLQEDIKAGAVGLGELMKDFGLTARKADGSRVTLDDPELDPIWATAARLNIPVIMHAADPASFWEPFDYSNERWLELALFRDRRCPPDPASHHSKRSSRSVTGYSRNTRKPSLSRRISAGMPTTLHAWPSVRRDAERIHARSGRSSTSIGRQPRAAHDFFVKYQDRLMFGKDNYAPDEYPYFWRIFETSDEYFDYYRDYHAFWKLYGIALPDDVLKKLYFGNALKIIPGLSRAGFPE